MNHHIDDILSRPTAPYLLHSQNNMLRLALAGRLLAQLESSSSSIAASSRICALQQQLQQQAGFAKRAETVDGRLQRVMKMLEPQEVEKIEVSDEDYAEGMRRCDTSCRCR